MSEDQGQMPEITEEETRILEELAQMRENDPEGYEALVGDRGPESEDPALAHAEWLAEAIAKSSEQNKQFAELLGRAWAEANNQ